MATRNEVLSIVKDLDESQLKLEKNAFDVINSSDTSLNLVKEGINEIEKLINKIDELNNSVKKSQQQIENMKEVYNVIAEFTKVISGIANKTNMLSLNASIESARAGEHGRGFAVVAEQVRNLASQTQKSSSEITSKISEVQNTVKDVVESMDTLFVSAKEQNEMASSIQGTLKQVLEAAMIANDVSRNMENEIAYQRDVTDKAKYSIECME